MKYKYLSFIYKNISEKSLEEFKKEFEEKIKKLQEILEKYLEKLEKILEKNKILNINLNPKVKSKISYFLDWVWSILNIFWK